MKGGKSTQSVIKGQITGKLASIIVHTMRWISYFVKAHHTHTKFHTYIKKIFITVTNTTNNHNFQPPHLLVVRGAEFFLQFFHLGIRMLQFRLEGLRDSFLLYKGHLALDTAV